MSEKLRWKIAYQLNRSKRLCWAELVTWALGWNGIRETAVSSSCRSDCERNGSCYCGKLSASLLPQGVPGVNPEQGRTK